MRYYTANDIINRAAVEIGLNPSTDPVASSDETNVQFTQLLNAVGQELLNLHDWQELREVIDFTTTGTDTGNYDLPDDFDRMINQTGWDRTNSVQVGGPLSAQDWTYLVGRDLVSQSIYASFRLTDSKMSLFPQPPPVGLRVTFEYISRNWVREQGQQKNNRDTVGTGSDTVRYDPIMAIKFLKLKYLQAKGLPAADAAMEFENMLESRLGRSEGSPILSAARNARAFPYLSPYGNTGDTGYGIP